MLRDLKAIARTLPLGKQFGIAYALMRNATHRLLGGEDEHWGRVVMNRTTFTWIEALDLAQLDVLEISGRHWEKSGLPFKSYESLAYPAFDVCSTELHRKFDLILAEQVFEHVLWPYQAARNVYRMLNDHGYFLLTTPFLARIHNEPHDCTRWTEVGIKYFLAECGFPIASIQTGAWGNRGCIKANFRAWVRYRRYVHSLRNEPSFPFVVWALARK